MYSEIDKQVNKSRHFFFYLLQRLDEIVDVETSVIIFRYTPVFFLFCFFGGGEGGGGRLNLPQVFVGLFVLFCFFLWSQRVKQTSRVILLRLFFSFFLRAGTRKERWPEWWMASVSRPWDFNWDVHRPRTFGGLWLHRLRGCQGRLQHFAGGRRVTCMTSHYKPEWIALCTLQMKWSLFSVCWLIGCADSYHS